MADMDLIDIFTGDGFGVIELTAAINKQPFVPGKVRSLGIFEERGIVTTSIEIEEIAGTLAIIPNTRRGAPASQNKHAKRVVRSLTVPHFPLEDTIMASELQNVRAFGSTTELENIQNKVAQRLGEIRKKHDATLEYGSIGAVKGLLLDSDGITPIYNLFNEFGVEQTSIDFTLGTAATNMLGNCTDVAGAIEDELGAAVYDHIHVLCGKSFWKRFVSHPAVQDAYKYFEATGQRVNPLREDLRYKGFQFGDLIFEQYRGQVSGVAFVADNEAHAFPIGLPGLFITRFAPADFVETVNTEGLPIYAKAAVDPMFQRFVALHTQSNPISLCTRPGTLIKLISSN